MKTNEYIRVKKAKGKTYYYFEIGRTSDGKPEYVRLPDKSDPKFGGSLARARATRTNRKNRDDIYTFERLSRAFQASKEFAKKAEATKRSYGRYLTVAEEWFRDDYGRSFPAWEVDDETVTKLRDALPTEGAASQAVRVVGALYAWARGKRMTKVNPASGVERWAGGEHLPWPEALVEEALADPDVGLAVALFYFTGQRIGDVIRMRWDDIKDGEIHVTAKKTGSELEIAIDPELQEKLDAAERVGETILVSSTGKPWTANGLRPKLQAWAAKRGHKVVPHGLRKNAVNSLLLAGCTPSEVKSITDHSLKMIEHYSKNINKSALSKRAIGKRSTARNKAGKCKTK